MAAAVMVTMAAERSAWKCTSGGMTESCDSFVWFSVTAPGRKDHFGQFQAELCHFFSKNCYSSVRPFRKSF